MKYIYKLMIENYARCTCLLKSPRSGKFVSNTRIVNLVKDMKLCFNPLDRGNLYQILLAACV